MKKILFMTAVIILLFACNVIYAKQTNIPQKVCDVQNCPQTRTPIHNTCETIQCYVEGCTNIQNHTHNNCGNRGISINGNHHKNAYHH